MYEFVDYDKPTKNLKLGSLTIWINSNTYAVDVVKENRCFIFKFCFMFPVRREGQLSKDHSEMQLSFVGLQAAHPKNRTSKTWQIEDK